MADRKGVLYCFISAFVILLPSVSYAVLGVEWTEATSNAAFAPRHQLSAVVYDNKMWVISGEPANSVPVNDVWWSTDGADWYLATGNAAFQGRGASVCMPFNDAMWLIGG